VGIRPRPPFIRSLSALAAIGFLVAAGPGSAAVDSSAEAPQVIRFHGGAYDRAGAIATDSGGNVYLAGALDLEGSNSTFGVVKLSPQGSLVWTAHYNGSLGGVGGQALAVTIDAAGNVYAAGYVHDGVIFNQNYDYLAVKFAPNGAQRWARRYNGPGNNSDFALRIVVDAVGNAYVTGFSYGQGYDWATLKLSPDGGLLWERRHSGPGAADDRVSDMALAPSGNVVLTGFVKRTGDGLTNDAETLTYNPQGAVVWQRQWTATTASHELPNDMDVDAAGRIAVTGTTAENASPYAVPFPVTVRYDAAGVLLQTIRDEAAGGQSVDVDALGNLYLAGYFVATPGASSVAKYDANGSRLWATPLTPDPTDVFRSVQVAAHATGAVTVAGTVSDVSTGDGDYVTLRYSAGGQELWRYRFAGNAGGQDEVAALAVEGSDAALITGTSWNGYLSSGGTADDIVTLRFPAGAAPALLPPSDLRATGVSRSEIRLSWQDNAGTEDGFRIERCLGVGCTEFALVATVGHDVTTYVDGGLSRNTQYTYRVQAFNDAAGSAYSNTASAKTRRR
jgi:uncharacterized delta-60 repeat protein